MDIRYEGKVALVTGAKQGIGLAVAEAFAENGATTIIADIQNTDAEVEALRSKGYKVEGVICDVADQKAVKAMIEGIVSRHGKLDCANNNAGVQTPQRPMAEITNDEYNKTVAVDLGGVWNCMKFEIEQMLLQGGGSIVNTSSQGGITGFPGQAAYIACKHAVLGLTRTASIDYAAKGIRINAVLPGCILTPMAKDIFRRNPAAEKELLRDIPLGRFGEPTEIADAVLWLCSPYASFVHGSGLVVDGAFTAH